MAAFLRLKTWQSSRPYIVACQNDSMAVGALKARKSFREVNLPRVPVTGCDGLQDGSRRLVDKRQLSAMVVTRPPRTRHPATRPFAKTNRPLPAEVLLAATSYPDEVKLGAVGAVRESPQYEAECPLAPKLDFRY